VVRRQSLFIILHASFYLSAAILPHPSPLPLGEGATPAAFHQGNLAVIPPGTARNPFPSNLMRIAELEFGAPGVRLRFLAEIRRYFSKQPRSFAKRPVPFAKRPAPPAQQPRSPVKRSWSSPRRPRSRGKRRRAEGGRPSPDRRRPRSSDRRPRSAWRRPVPFGRRRESPVRRDKLRWARSSSRLFQRAAVVSLRRTPPP